MSLCVSSCELSAKLKKCSHPDFTNPSFDNLFFVEETWADRVAKRMWPSNRRYSVGAAQCKDLKERSTRYPIFFYILSSYCLSLSYSMIIDGGNSLNPLSFLWHYLVRQSSKIFLAPSLFRWERNFYPCLLRHGIAALTVWCVTFRIYQKHSLRWYVKERRSSRQHLFAYFVRDKRNIDFIPLSTYHTELPQDTLQKHQH